MYSSASENIKQIFDRLQQDSIEACEDIENEVNEVSKSDIQEFFHRPSPNNKSKDYDRYTLLMPLKL